MSHVTTTGQHSSSTWRLASNAKRLNWTEPVAVDRFLFFLLLLIHNDCSIFQLRAPFKATQGIVTHRASNRRRRIDSVWCQLICWLKYRSVAVCDFEEVGLPKESLINRILYICIESIRWNANSGINSGGLNICWSVSRGAKHKLLIWFWFVISFWNAISFRRFVDSMQLFHHTTNFNEPPFVS